MSSNSDRDTHQRGLGLPERTSDDTDGDVQRLLGRLEESGNALRIVRLLANASTAFKPFVLMSTALMAKASLPAPDREVVILYLAARGQVAYEWAEHVPMSEQVGISDEQRDVLARADLDDLSAFTESQRLALTVADNVIVSRQLPPPLWERARATWGVEGALELVLTIAWWGGFVPTVIDALGITPPR